LLTASKAICIDRICIVADHNAIVESLREHLKQGDKALVGNTGYRKYLAAPKPRNHFQIDEGKILEEITVEKSCKIKM